MYIHIFHSSVYRYTTGLLSVCPHMHQAKNTASRLTDLCLLDLNEPKPNNRKGVPTPGIRKNSPAP